MARVITGLPYTTRTQILLLEAGLPPLTRLLDTRSPRYSIRVLLSNDTHLSRQILLTAMKNTQSKTGTRLKGIAQTVQQLIGEGPELKTSATTTGPFIPTTEVGKDKEETSKKDQKWITAIPRTDVLVYTDSSKTSQIGQPGDGYPQKRMEPQTSCKECAKSESTATLKMARYTPYKKHSEL